MFSQCYKNPVLGGSVNAVYSMQNRQKSGILEAFASLMVLFVLAIIMYYIISGILCCIYQQVSSIYNSVCSSFSRYSNYEHVPSYSHCHGYGSNTNPPPYSPPVYPGPAMAPSCPASQTFNLTAPHTQPSGFAQGMLAGVLLEESMHHNYYDPCGSTVVHSVNYDEGCDIQIDCDDF